MGSASNLPPNFEPAFPIAAVSSSTMGRGSYKQAHLAQRSLCATPGEATELARVRCGSNNQSSPPRRTAPKALPISAEAKIPE